MPYQLGLPCPPIFSPPGGKHSPEAWIISTLSAEITVHCAPSLQHHTNIKHNIHSPASAQPDSSGKMLWPIALLKINTEVKDKNSSDKLRGVRSV